MPYRMNEKKVMLIADDTPANRALLKKIFDTDYQIEEAVNGLVAVEKLRNLPEITVLVLDLFMPELDGFEVLSMMMDDEKLSGIPTVVVTANDDEETQIKALACGAADVLTKPFNPQIILHRINNIISRKEADRLSERNKAIERELQLLNTDEKTGLYNKHAFHRYAALLLKSNPEKKYILMRWDINNFKVFNDCFGTEAGDAYLRKVGDYYRDHMSTIPGLVLCARYDAEHFVCIREEGTFNAEEVLTCINTIFEQNKQYPFEYKATIGLYEITDSRLDIALMCDRALMALRSIKNEYNRQYAWYDDTMRATLIEEQGIVNEMEAALKEKQFVAYLQPQYDYSGGELVGAEALVRWIHPEKSIISPDKFIPLFERNGFITKLDEEIWEQVCRLICSWKEQGLPLVPISVNVSRRDIYNPNLCDIIMKLLNQYNISPSLLHIEITETAYTQNAEQLINIVYQLRKNGIEVHMDDFGSGYSSLNTLVNVPVDLLKLDMRFLGGDYSDERNTNLLNGIVSMAKALKLPVLAEGVETKEQADCLRETGCVLMQGYYFARPMPAEEFSQLLTKQKTKVCSISS